MKQAQPMNRFRAIIAILIGTSGLVGTRVLAATPGAIGTKAPALVAGPWSAGKPVTLESLKGKVVLLSFWTTGCINCRRTVPYWNGWAKRFADSNDFAVVSVHTPETSAERSISVSRDYVKTNGVAFPVLVDNDYKNWNAFGIQFWPTTLLIDKNGIVRGRWEGELNYDNAGTFHEVDTMIARLFKEKAK